MTAEGERHRRFLSCCYLFYTETHGSYLNYSLLTIDKNDLSPSADGIIRKRSTIFIRVKFLQFKNYHYDLTKKPIDWIIFLKNFKIQFDYKNMLYLTPNYRYFFIKNSIIYICTYMYISPSSHLIHNFHFD